MALEQELAALRDEVQKLTAVTTKLLEARTEAIETVRSAAAPAASKPAAAKKETDKPAPEKAETPAPEKAETPAPEKAAAPAEDDLGDEALKAHVAAYVNFGAADDSPITTEERAARMAKVRSVLDHEKIKAKTVAEVPQNARKAFRKKINEFVAEIETNGPLTAPAETGAAGEVDDL